MALISCPECGKEISDKVKACPNCGYPMVDSAEPSSPAEPSPQPDDDLSTKADAPKKNKIVIVCVAVVAIIAAIAIGFFVHQQQVKAEAEAEYNAYLSNLVLARSTMLGNAANCEKMSMLIHDVWYNTIFEESDSVTDKYTKSGSQFNSDFNTSLANLISDESIVQAIEGIVGADQHITEILKLLQSPPDEFKECYSTLNDLYTAYNAFVKLATGPSGTLTSYTESYRKCEDEFMLAYDKLGLQIPDQTSIDAPTSSTKIS